MSASLGYKKQAVLFYNLAEKTQTQSENSF